MKRVHIIISGDVVGVGYRSWVRKQAQDLELSGWVKNREDKAVELVVEGDRIALEELVARCRRGPDVAWVKGIETKWLSATGEFIDFSVLY